MKTQTNRAFISKNNKKPNNYQNLKDQMLNPEVPLANRGAEESVIYILFHHAQSAVRIQEKLEEHHFFYRETKALFKACSVFRSENEDCIKIDVKGIPEILARTDELGNRPDQVPEDYILQVYGLTGTNCSAGYTNRYIKQLKDAYAVRQLVGSLQAKDLYANPDNVRNVMADLHKTLFEVEQEIDENGELNDFSPFDDKEALIDENDPFGWNDPRNQKPTPITNIPFLDGDNGWKYPKGAVSIDNGMVITVLSSTGGFKTAFAMQVALESAMQKGINVLFCCTELGRKELRQRLISRLTGIPSGDLSRFKKKQIQPKPDQLALIVGWGKALAGQANDVKLSNGEIRRCEIKGRIDILDSIDRGAYYLKQQFKKRNAIAQLSSKYNNQGYGLLICDQVQDLGSDEEVRSGGSQANLISANMRVLKNIATKNDIVVLCVSHVNDEKCVKENGMIIPTEYSALDSREPVRKCQICIGLSRKPDNSQIRIEVIKAGNDEKNVFEFVDLKPESYRIGC